MKTSTICSKIRAIQIASQGCHDEHCKTLFTRVGRYNAQKIYRTLLKLRIDNVPKDASIIRADLKTNIAEVQNSSVVMPYALIEGWEPCTVNWNNQPSFDPDICGKDVYVKRELNCSFDITYIVKKWHDNSIPNRGIILKNSELKDATLIKMLPEMTLQICYSENPSDCNCNSKCFAEKSRMMYVGYYPNYSKWIDTSSGQIVMFFIKNLGTYDITAHLEVSPDKVDIIDEPSVIKVSPGEMKFIVPCIFSKFTRIVIRSMSAGEVSLAKLWYQAQNFKC